MDRKKIEVHFYTNSNCNLKCKHCYENIDQSIMSKENVLTAERIRTLCEILMNRFDIDIHMEGGEIFLRDDIPEIFDRMIDDIKCRITLTTNGTIPWQKAYLALLGIKRLRFSVEGHTDRFQQEIRGISLESVLNNLKVFKEHGIPVSLRVTLFRDNYSHLHDMIEEMSQWGTDFIEFHEYRAVGRGMDYLDQYKLKDKDYCNLLDILCEKQLGFEGTEIRINLSREVMAIPNFMSKLHDIGYDVNVPEFVHSIAIGCNGDIYPCSWEYGNILGNINHDDLIHIIQNSKKMREHYDYCNNCTALNIRSKI